MIQNPFINSGGSGGVSALPDLTDVPSDIYTGASGKAVIVNATADGLDTTPLSGGGDMLIATYDPNSVGADCFDAANIVYDNTASGLTATQVEAAINEITAKTLRVEYFEEISGTSGTLTLPTGATIVLDQYADAVDAIVRVIAATGQKPGPELATTAGGGLVTVTLSGVGNADYTLSDTPSGTQWAVCYVFDISLTKLGNITEHQLVVVNELASHTELTDIGTNTHAEIDTHIASTGEDHSYIDQSVVSGATPTLTGTNFTGTAAGFTAGAVSTITGLAPNTATTQATQPNITTCAGLVSVQGHTVTLTGNLIRSGAHALTVTTTGATGVTLPTSGTLATTAAATSTTTGLVELAIASELNTGTDTERAVTPDALAGSVFGRKGFGIAVIGSTTDTSVGAGTIAFPVPVDMVGMNIVYCLVVVHTAGVTGTMEVQIRRRRGASDADVLSTVMTVDTTETSSATAATPYVIDTANDDLAEGDSLYVDIDQIHTTAAKGLSVFIAARLP